MRNLIITSVFFLIATISYGQSFSVAPSTKRAAADTITVNIAGKDFQGGKSRSGSTWILRTSAKSGKIYKSYLGHESDSTITVDGKTYNVWSNKTKENWNDPKAVFYFYTISEKTGYPSKTKLVKN